MDNAWLQYKDQFDPAKGRGKVVPWVRRRPDVDPAGRYKKQLALGLRFDIKSGEKVLDVGSFIYPFPLATHRAGIDPGDDVGDGKPFYLADVVKGIPVPDKFFDFVYCCHVLEHVSDPVAAAAEMGRIGKRGYFEVPSGFASMFLFLAWLHCDWFCTKAQDGAIVFSRWDPKTLEVYSNRDASKIMHRVVNGPIKDLSAGELGLRRFYEGHLAFYNVGQCWSGSPRVRVKQIFR